MSNRAYEALSPPVYRITERETQVLITLAANGYGEKEAGRTLGISLNTVHAHMRKMRQRLGVFTNMQALYIAMQRGLIQ